jgi:hypothetical protein
MAQPSNSTVTIDGQSFDSLSSHVEVSTVHDDKGLPVMGTLKTAINAIVDIHDDVNMPFGTLSQLFDLANMVTRDKVKDIKVEYWKDDAKQDALCSFSFRGWISQYSVTSGAGGNHTLRLQLQPELNSQQFVQIKMGN